MPELPEVQTIVTTLKPMVCGRKILAVRLLRDDIISPARFDLMGGLHEKTIFSIDRRGKKIVFTLDDGNRFVIHLGMTGRLSVEAENAPLAPHTHLLVNLESGQMRFVDPRRFGGVFWLGAETSADEGMGPEPLTMRPTQLAERLAHTTRAVKTALLDQSLVAGLGNIYVDESLFESGIHPLIPANRLSRDQIAALNRAIKQVLRRALRHRGSTLRDYRDADGNPGDFQKLHRVYDRAGQPCAVCKTPIARLVLGGRSSHFCPNCQKRKPKTARTRIHK
jgi:formamidopyrimidine-DNA glycosylase